MLKFSKRYLLLPALMLVFFVLFYFLYDSVKKSTIEEFNSEQLILAETASRGITNFFDDYKSDMTFLAQFNDIINFSDDSKTLMARFYEQHKNYIQAITRVDSNGVILYTYPENNSVTGRDISYQEHVQQILANRRPVISDAFKSVQGFMSIAVHVPVVKQNKFVGTLAILIPIDKLGKKYLENIKIRGSGKIWIISESGMEIYCPVKNHKGKMYRDITHNNSLANDFLELIKTEHSGTVKSVHDEKSANESDQFIEQYMAFYRATIDNTYWTIVISYHEKEVYLALSRFRNRLILIFSLFFIIMLLYFYILSKYRNVLKEEAKRKQAEEILLESEKKFRTIFDASPIGIEIYDASGVQLNANAASLKMFGIPDVSEVKNFNIFEGTSLNTVNKQKLRKGKTVAYEALFDFEKVKELKQYVTHNQGTAYFDYIITPLFDILNKKIIGYLVQVQDITERKRAEEEILMLAHSLRSVNECVSITDLKNNIVFVNDSFLKIYGYREDELIGKNVNIFDVTKIPGNLKDRIFEATLKGGWKGELINKRKDGSSFPIHLSTTAIQDKAGKILGFIGVASDITESKKRQQELIEAKEKAVESDRLKSAFLTNMSHEIRTPMNGILGFAELLKEPNLKDDQQLEFINVIQKSGKRMLNIINDIVDISKIESGQMEIAVNEVDVNEQIKSLHAFFKPEADQKEIKLTIGGLLAKDNSVINTDPVKLNSILTNLLKNALKYTDKGYIEVGVSTSSTTNLKADSEPDELKFYVKDTGIGVPKERQHVIFDRFIQADIEDKDARQGAGLGLSITKAYIEMLGGEIRLESQEGSGSTFYFTIPSLQKATQKKRQKGIAEVMKPFGEIKPLKVLVAEDDEFSGYLLRLYLKSFCKEYITVKSGTAAVETCRTNPDIDLLLMDIQLPELNGYEAVRQIRQFNKEIIIIAQTAYGLADDKKKALDAGCNDYISKPVNKDWLTEIIKTCMQNKITNKNL